MPSSRAPLVKSLDVRRRTLAPHSGEAARMPGKSGRHDQPASQPASPQLWASRLSLPGLAGPCLSACWPLDLIHISHFLACHPPIHLHSFNPSSRDTAHTISHSQSYQHFISRPPATRACDLRCYACLGRTPSLPQSCPAQRMTSRSAKVRHVRVFSFHLPR